MTKQNTSDESEVRNTGRERDSEPEESTFKVDDRRHWQVDEAEDDEESVEVEPQRPTIVDEYLRRAEDAERKLLEYIEAFKRHKDEHERVRERLSRDVERKVDLRFGQLLGELLETLDDLDLGLEHAEGIAEAEPLTRGVAMARDRFLATLNRHGVEPIRPEGSAFDPHEAEALRVDPVDSPDDDQVVTVTLKPGYRLGERVIRAAKVAVGKYSKPAS